MIPRILYDLGIEIKRNYPRPMIRYIKDTLKDNLIGVEIGTFRGFNSKSRNIIVESGKN